MIRESGLWWITAALVLIVLVLTAHVNAAMRELRLQERRIHRLELMLDGAIEQVDHAASDIDVLETRIADAE